MKPLGDYADFFVDKFRNSRVADIFMYIGSTIISFFRGLMK